MYDFTEEEEENLPLPPNWIRSIDCKGKILYKDMRLNIESDEHPYILKALVAARKIPLESGWVVKEVMQNDGSKEFFYYNAEQDVSGWDPPHLRKCLSDLLIKEGYLTLGKNILTNPIPATTLALQSQEEQEEEPDADYPQAPMVTMKVDNKEIYTSMMANQQVEDNKRTNVQQSTADQLSYQTMQSLELSDNSDEGSSDSEGDNIPRQQLQSESERIYDHNMNNEQSAEYDDVQGAMTQHELLVKSQDEIEYYPPMMPMEEDNMSYSGNTAEISVAGLLNTPSIVGSMSFSPNRLANIDHLRRRHHHHNHKHSLKRKSSNQSQSSKGDIFTSKGLNEISIQNMCKKIDKLNLKLHCDLADLRIELSKKRAVRSSLLVHSSTVMPKSYKPTYDTNIVDKIVEGAQFLWSFALDNLNLLVSSLYLPDNTRDDIHVLIFTLMHRLLHPYSTTSSLTTTLLLEALNIQIEYAGLLSEEESDNSERSNKFQSQMGRLFFQSEFHHLFDDWNPENIAMAGVVVDINSRLVDSPLSALLKCYSIRRDVSCYFRLIWNPVFPAIIACTESRNKQSPEVINFGNLFSLAVKILECVLLNEVVVALPSSASAVIKCLNDICGTYGAATYYLYYLLLPNLIKMIWGDNDSCENESSYRGEFLSELSNKYYDVKVWWPVKQVAFTESCNTMSININNTASMITWMVWRIFVCALHNDVSNIPTYTAEQFFESIQVNALMTDIANTKIRKVIDRMRMKILGAVDLIIQLPLDNEGSRLLNVDTIESMCSIHVQSPEMGDTLRNRMNSILLMKPPETSNRAIVTRHETVQIFDTLAYYLEENLKNNTMEEFHYIIPIIEEFIGLNDTIDDAMDKNYAESVDDHILLGYMKLVIQNDAFYNEITSSGSPPPVPEGELYQHSTASSHQKVYEAYNDEYEYESPNIIEFHDIQVPSQADLPPPPDDLEYRYDQLIRSKNMIDNYEVILEKLYERVCNNKPTSTLSNLLLDDYWLFRTENEIELSLKIITNGLNAGYGKNTTSFSGKVRDAHYGFGYSQLESKNYFTSLKVKEREYFQSFRFNNSSRRAEANTTLSINVNKSPPRHVNNKLTPHMLTYRKHFLINSLKQNAKQQDHSQRPKFMMASRSKYTKVTLSKQSHLLVPTESYASTPHNDPTTQQQQEKYFQSFRDHKPLPQRPKVADLLKNYNPSRPLSVAKPFPKQLERTSFFGTSTHLQDDYCAEEVHGRDQDQYSMRSLPHTSSWKGNNSRKIDESERNGRIRKYPSSIEGLKSDFLVPTESLLNKFTKEFENDTEITSEQEKGWEHLLRHSDSASISSKSSSKRFLPVGPTITPSKSSKQPIVPEFLDTERLSTAERDRIKSIKALKESLTVLPKEQRDLTGPLRKTIQSTYSAKTLEQLAQPNAELDMDDFDTLNSILNHQNHQVYHEDEADDQLEDGPALASHPPALLSHKTQRQNEVLPTVYNSEAKIGLTDPSTQQPILDIDSHSDTKSDSKKLGVLERFATKKNNGDEFKVPKSADHTKVENTKENKKDMTLQQLNTSGSSYSISGPFQDAVDLKMDRINSPNLKNTVDSNYDENKDYSNMKILFDYSEKKTADGQHVYETESDTSEFEKAAPLLPTMKSKKSIRVVSRQLSMSKNDLIEKLMNGYQVMKYSTNGYPKEKHLYYDADSQEIKWRPTKKEFIMSVFKRNYVEVKSMAITDITEVRKGVQSDVFVEAGLLDPLCCLSIVSAERSLDVVFRSGRERDLANSALVKLLEGYPKVSFR